jgi:hypothetical protein
MKWDVGHTGDGYQGERSWIRIKYKVYELNEGVAATYAVSGAAHQKV